MEVEKSENLSIESAKVLRNREKKLFQCQIEEFIKKNLSLHSIMEFNYNSARKKRELERISPVKFP